MSMVEVRTCSDVNDVSNVALEIPLSCIGGKSTTACVVRALQIHKDQLQINVAGVRVAVVSPSGSVEFAGKAKEHPIRDMLDKAAVTRRLRREEAILLRDCLVAAIDWEGPGAHSYFEAISPARGKPLEITR